MGFVARRDDVLTLVHPGRRVELFREPIRAGELMRRYPRQCIGRPDEFEFPWIAVHPEAVLQQQQQHSSSKQFLHCLNYNRHNNSHQESCDAGNLYKLIRRLMKRNVNEETEESSYFYYRAESPVDSSPRPRVTSGELTELLRLKPCLRQPDSDRRKLNLRVTFADPAPFFEQSERAPSDQQDNQALKV